MTSAVPVVYDEASHSSHAIDSATSRGRPALCQGIRSDSSVFQGSIGVIVGPLKNVSPDYALTDFSDNNIRLTVRLR